MSSPNDHERNDGRTNKKKTNIRETEDEQAMTTRKSMTYNSIDAPHTIILWIECEVDKILMSYIA